MESWNRNKYDGVINADFLICLDSHGISDEYTTNVKYDIVYINDKIHTEISIICDNGSVDRFNIHSPFGDRFCTLKYLRKKKLKRIKQLLKIGEF